MVLDLLALGIVAAFAALGAWRGTLASASRICVLVAAYGAAWFASTRLGGPVGDAIGMNGFVGGAVAGLIAFVGALVVVGFATRLLLRGGRRGAFKRSLPDRLGGGLIGASYGLMIALMIAWMALWLDAAHEAGAIDLGLKTDGSSVAQKATRKVLRAGGGLALGDGPGAQMAVNLISSPTETLASIDEITESQSVIKLQGDRLFWQYVSTGAVDQALNRGSFMRVAHDDRLRGQLADLGVVSEAARTDPAQFRGAMREVLGQVGPALKELQNDPELQALFADPEIQRAAQEGDTVALMSHPGFRRLLRRVVARVESN